MADPQFRLDDSLAHLYSDAPRPLALRATTPEQFQQWQTALHARTMDLLGLAGRTRPAPAAELLAEKDCDEYVEQKWALDVGEDVRTPMYLLVPKTPGPWKTVLVTHGHSPSIQHVLGYFVSEEKATQRLALDGNYAQHAAQQGYFVCALEQRGFAQKWFTKWL